MSVTQRPSVVLATSIAAPLAGLAQATARGRVLAAFERSAYLDLDGRVIALLRPGLGRGPFAISLVDPAPLESMPPGAAVRLDAGLLRAGTLSINVVGAAPWDPSLAGVAGRLGSGSPPPARRRLVVDALARLAPPESIVGIVAPSARRVVVTHAALIAALDLGLEAVRRYAAGHAAGHADDDDVAGAVGAQIAGRGPGLTPSGDDLLVGIMHALTVWPALAAERGAAELRALLSEASAPRTTRISRAYLTAASLGLATEPWHDFVHSLTEDDDTVLAAVSALLHVGETSGADAVTGFCWAWTHLAAREERRP